MIILFYISRFILSFKEFLLLRFCALWKLWIAVVACPPVISLIYQQDVLLTQIFVFLADTYVYIKPTDGHCGFHPIRCSCIVLTIFPASFPWLASGMCCYQNDSVPWCVSLVKIRGSRSAHMCKTRSAIHKHTASRSTAHRIFMFIEFTKNVQAVPSFMLVPKLIEAIKIKAYG